MTPSVAPLVDPTATAQGITKISTKYQIVIPREVRERAGLREGQTLYVYSTADGEFCFSTKSPFQRAREYFRGSKLWGDDPVATIRRDRETWDERPEQS